MNSAHSHILNLGVITIICGGVVMALVKPVDAAPSRVTFVKWLHALAKKKCSNDLEKQQQPLKQAEAVTVRSYAEPGSSAVAHSSLKTLAPGSANFAMASNGRARFSGVLFFIISTSCLVTGIVPMMGGIAIGAP